MAGQQVTLVGVAYGDKSTNAQPVTIVAEMYSTGLGVGGGPMPGGRPPHAEHPMPPYPDQGLPGNQPYPGQGLPGNQPYPDQSLPGYQPHPDQGLPGNQPVVGWPPIAMPPIFYPPPVPPVGSGDGDGFVKPPPDGGGWGYHESYGWLFSPRGAGPKTSP